MYLRPVHTDLELATLYDFILQNPLGVLTTAIPSPDYPTIQTSHIPWVLDIPSSTDTTTDATSPPSIKATLRGHLARANPHTKSLIASLLSQQTPQSTPTNGVLEHEVLILFTHQTHHYVTPKFYTTTKPLTGKTVPTWNYSAVQAYGKIKIYFSNDTPETGEFLATQINDLSRQSEEGIMGYSASGEAGKEKSWSVNEAPESYIRLLTKAIMGVEVQVERLEGKFKMSQESPEGDRRGTVEGFRKLGTQVGDEMARTIEWREEVMLAKKKEKEGSAS